MLFKNEVEPHDRAWNYIVYKVPSNPGHPMILLSVIHWNVMCHLRPDINQSSIDLSADITEWVIMFDHKKETNNT